MAPYTNYLKRQDWLVEYSLGTSGPAVPKKMLELEMQRDSLHCPQSLLLAGLCCVSQCWDVQFMAGAADFIVL